MCWITRQKIRQKQFDKERDGMKRFISLILSLTFVLVLAGCNNRSMNYIIENEPSVVGVVEEVHDDYVIMYSETAEGYPNGSRWSISLTVESKDSMQTLLLVTKLLYITMGMLWKQTL